MSGKAAIAIVTPSADAPLTEREKLLVAALTRAMVKQLRANLDAELHGAEDDDGHEASPSTH